MPGSTWLEHSALWEAAFEWFIVGNSFLGPLESDKIELGCGKLGP